MAHFSKAIIYSIRASTISTFGISYGREGYNIGSAIKEGGCVVDTESVGLLTVSIIFGAIAIIEGVIISPIFYSMAGIIFAMLGYFIVSDRLKRKKSEELPRQKE